MPYQMQIQRFGDLAADATANGGGPLIQQGGAQGSLSPAALHLSPAAMHSFLSQFPIHLDLAVASTMPATAGARCDCMLSAVPGLASQPDQLAAGRALCVQDPDAFEQQLNAAGWHPVCDGSTSSASGGGAATGTAMARARAFVGTTGGKVAIGVGVLAVIGIGVAVASRKKGRR